MDSSSTLPVSAISTMITFFTPEIRRDNLWLCIHHKFIRLGNQIRLSNKPLKELDPILKTKVCRQIPNENFKMTFKELHNCIERMSLLSKIMSPKTYIKMIHWPSGEMKKTFSVNSRKMWFLAKAEKGKATFIKIQKLVLPSQKLKMCTRGREL
jgi:hypothetical protein